MKEMLKQWIYRAKFDCTVNIKPTTRQGIYDNGGGLIQMLEVKPINLVFNAGHCTVNEQFAKEHNLTLETLIKVIESCPRYGKSFNLIHSPENKASKELMKEIEKAPVKKKVIHGPRK